VFFQEQIPLKAFARRVQGHWLRSRSIPADVDSLPGFSAFAGRGVQQISSLEAAELSGSAAVPSLAPRMPRFASWSAAPGRPPG
jgi:predicted metalloendopeptidase